MKFDTEGGMVAYLVRSGYRQNDEGEWHRDSWHALVKRLKNGKLVVTVI